MRHKSNQQAGSQGFGLPSPFARAAVDQRFGVASRLTAARVFLSAFLRPLRLVRGEGWGEVSSPTFAGASRRGCLLRGLQTNSGREASGLHLHPAMHLLVILILILLTPFAFAQGEPVPVLTAAPDPVTAFIQMLAGRYPWVVAAWTLVGFLRMVFKPAMGWMHKVVAETSSLEDDAALERVEHSTAFKVFAFLLDYTASIKLIKGTGPLATKLFVGSLLFLALLGTGCRAFQDKWDGLSPATQTALENGAKLAAKAALQIGLSQLGDSVHELKPFTQKLTPLFEATFSQAAPGSQAGALGEQLRAHVESVVPPEHRPAVTTALKDALARESGATAAAPGQSAIGNRKSAFNAALAAKL